MGSAFTSDLAAMTSFARALKGKGFFFVDSVTSAGTVGVMAMGRKVFPRRRRDVFLDETAGRGDAAPVATAIALAKERARRFSCATPPETHKALLELLPQLRREGIRP